MTEFELAIATLRAHEPVVDWAYQYLSCACGWTDPEEPGVRRIRDGASDYGDHLRRAMRRAFKEAAR